MARTATVNVLFVCTYNQVRSPLAAALFERRVRGNGSHAKARSCGLRSNGLPCPEALVSIARSEGLDLSRHLSRQIGEEAVSWASLVLGMTREHVRDIVVRFPQAWPQTFTLTEFVRRASELGASQLSQPADVLIRLGAARSATDLLGFQTEDDIEDPILGDFSEFVRVYQLLDSSVDSLVKVLEPRVVPTDPRRSSGCDNKRSNA